MVVTVFDREKEFSSEGFYVFDKTRKILMCKYCNVRIEWQRKDTCLKHINNSASHKKNKEKVLTTTGVKRQVTLTDASAAAKRAKIDKEEFVLSTTRAFIEANIPLEKVDHPKLREWMNKYVPGAGDLPSAGRLREGSVPRIIKEEEERLKEAVKDERVSILCDETTDRKGQCVFMVLIKVVSCGDGTVQKLFVGGVKVIANANATECSQAVMSVIHKLEIQYRNVVSITSDSARYMSKCINAIRVLVSEGLVHTQCWAHKLNLVGNVWAMELCDLNHCVVQAKHIFLNTRKRKHAYIQFLNQKYEGEPTKAKLFPIPVITRWNSWFKSVEYLGEYLYDIVEFVETVEDESVAVNYFKALTSNEVKKIQCLAIFLVEHCSKCCNLLLTLESSKIPLIHVLQSKLNDLSKTFKLLEDAFFFETTSDKLSKLPKQMQVHLTSLFQSVGRASLIKLNHLMECDTGKIVISSIGKLFDPRSIMKGELDRVEVSQLIKKIPILQELSASEYLEPYTVFRDLVGSSCREGKDVDVIAILLSLKSEYGHFVEAAVKALWIPVSNVDSERSFSTYCNIMSDRRTALTPSNMEVMVYLSFSD